MAGHAAHENKFFLFLGAFTTATEDGREKFSQRLRPEDEHNCVGPEKMSNQAVEEPERNFGRLTPTEWINTVDVLRVESDASYK